MYLATVAVDHFAALVQQEFQHLQNEFQLQRVKESNETGLK